MYTLKKSLGQHFLRDERVCKRIVQVLEQRPLRRLLEIGPGGGALTKYLLQIPAVELKCVEVDDEKVQWLLQSYPLLNGHILHEDFLLMAVPFQETFTVVGNFPYNISSQILFKILDWKERVDTMVGMFQKEVAQRVVTKEGSKVYGVLSVLIQAFFHAEYLFEVHEHSFIPPPKVKSAVVRLTPITPIPPMSSEKDFFRLVKTAFNQRRKTLRNAVRAIFDPTTLKEEIFDKRAEQLKVEDFARLTFKMR